MAERLAIVVSLAAAAGALYAICRQLSCGRFPAAFGAAAWALSEAMLRPGGSAAGPPAAATSVLVPFALAGVFSREKRRWPILALGVVCLALRWRSPAGAAAAELEAMVLAVLAALGAQRLWDGEGGAAFLIGAAASVAVAGTRGGAAAERLLEAAPAGAALAMVAVVSREFRARAGLVALVALFALQRAAEIAWREGPGPAIASAAAARPR